MEGRADSVPGAGVLPSLSELGRILGKIIAVISEPVLNWSVILKGRGEEPWKMQH